MRKPFLLIFSFLFIFTIQAQEWYTDLDQAKAAAKKENKTIILVFQGSDWCAPCMKLEKEIWKSDAFLIHAKENYVMLQADFPRRKVNRLPKEQEEKNKLLAEMYNQNGYFPHVVILNAEGGVLGRTGYQSVSPEEYIKLIDAFKVN